MSFSPLSTAYSLSPVEMRWGYNPLQHLLHSFERRFDDSVGYACLLLRGYSPFPVEATVMLVILTFIAIWQVVLLRASVSHRKSDYVCWQLHDRITTEIYKSYNSQNHLSTAVILYLSQKLWREAPLTAAELHNKCFTVHLLSLYCEDAEEGFDSSEDEELLFRRDAKIMVAAKLPIFPFWTPTRQDGVEACVWMSVAGEGVRSDVAKRSIFLRAPKRGCPGGGSEAAEASLQRFVDAALAYYYASGYSDKGEIERNLRMYRVSPSEKDILVESVPLPIGPTLETVFFKQREEIQRLLRRFMEKSHRYAVEGFPHKLGFLLYGPRGTGKRSFVRALAYHTHRHVVRIPLSSLTNNRQLHSVFFFESSSSRTAPEWKTLKSKKVIFLIEDIDTTSDAVRARDGGHVVHMRRAVGLTTRKCRDAGGEVEKTLSDSIVPQHPCKASLGCRREREKPCSLATPLVVPEWRLKTRGLGQLLLEPDQAMDKLDLSSLLNVLDGIVEMPERIVVAIVDHPERLDPALLRPGRLSTHIRFDYLELNDLSRIAGLFFGATYAEPHEPGFPPEDCVAMYDALSLEGTTQEEEVMRLWSAAHVTTSLKKVNQSPTLLGEATVLDKVPRQLAKEQLEQVRSCIASLENECSASGQTSRAMRYNFFITAAHAHHLCKNATNLEEFLEALRAYIRSGGTSP